MIFDEIEVGSEVFCILCGNGIVMEINKNATYPIVVEFEGNTNSSYTEEGKLFEFSKTITLYHPGTTFSIQPAPKPLPEINDGELVWVWDKSKEDKVIRVAKETYDKHGNIEVYLNGRYSGEYASYDNFKKANT